VLKRKVFLLGAPFWIPPMTIRVVEFKSTEQVSNIVTGNSGNKFSHPFSVRISDVLKDGIQPLPVTNTE
jgi:hypothetical protein